MFVRPTIFLLLVSALILSWIPAQASDFPDICVPDPYISIPGNGQAETTILFNPGLSTECGAWDYDLITIDHPAEAAWLHYRIEHEYRIGQTTTWDSQIIAQYTLSPYTLEANDTGGAIYSLNHSIDIQPGHMASNDHRYRLVVELSGVYSNSPSAPYSVFNDFLGTFSSAWIDYTVLRKVNNRFEDRPGDYIPAQRQDPAPVGGLQTR